MHQTPDLIIPVNYTTSKSQRQARYNPTRLHPPPHCSEQKEFAGRLRGLAEHVAAGEGRGCCWRELICSCCWCVTVTASFLKGNPPVALISFPSHLFPPIRTDKQGTLSVCINMCMCHTTIFIHCRQCLHLFIH